MAATSASADMAWETADEVEGRLEANKADLGAGIADLAEVEVGIDEARLGADRYEAVTAELVARDEAGVVTDVEADGTGL